MQEAGDQEQYMPAARYNGTVLTAERNPGIRPWGGF